MVQAIRMNNNSLNGQDAAASTLMDASDVKAIVARFFEALALLTERRVIRGKKTFCVRYGINRWNMNYCIDNPESGIFKMSWLAYLVRDYKVSANWLLLGKGDPLPPPTGEELKRWERYKKRKAQRS